MLTISKSFNDHTVHAAGDTVLQMIASTLVDPSARAIIVARYGGEEFVIAMPETDTDTALPEARGCAAGDRCDACPGVEKRAARVHHNQCRLAGLPDDGTNDEDLISVADARLFEAKRNGRNQIVVSKTVEL
jgi:two-component system cell cycle response regulator